MGELDEQIAGMQRVERQLSGGSPPNDSPPVFVTGDDGNDSNRPQLKLPTDNRELHHFARDIGQLVCHRSQEDQLFVLDTRARLFRRDMSPVIVNVEAKRLDSMSAELFRTWAAQFVACYREKKHGELRCGSSGQ
jgi:hypothetical protein